MNWIIDILLVVVLGYSLASWAFDKWIQEAVEDGYIIVGHRLYKITEVKNER